MENQEIKLNPTTYARLVELLKAECAINAGNDLMQSLAFVTRTMMQETDDKEITEMKKYEFDCEIEMHPLHVGIDANTAEEAIELQRQLILDDEGFLQDIDARDFYIMEAHQLKMTPEYKEYVDRNKQ